MRWIKRVAWLLLWLGVVANRSLRSRKRRKLRNRKRRTQSCWTSMPIGAVRAKSMAPTVESLVQAGYAVRRINIDQQPGLARQYDVSAIPCFVVVQERARNRPRDRHDHDRAAENQIARRRSAIARCQVRKSAQPHAAWRYERPVGRYSAVVRIRCELANNQRALGSGVLVRWGGRIVVLTARHVVRDARTIVVRLVTGKEHAARVLVTSQWDCTVLQLDGDPVGVEPAKMELGEAAVFHAGDRLTSCGYGGSETKLAANTRSVYRLPARRLRWRRTRRLV